ncbi:unannotated protein [freshwater metagenome]|uniref:Unannotated protein n=1 Tax=freshwater metagenome TaxID=449393 RepID=A0A6J6MC28_9ZZZZ|nr:hypothetical protein [Actinomycetota bacterium]
MSERLSINELPASTVWALRELGLVGVDNSVSREHVRTLGEFVVRFAGVPATTPIAQTPAPSFNGEAHPTAAPVRTRARRGPTKAERRSEMTMQISRYLQDKPGVTLEEIAEALNAPLTDVTAAARPVDWLILGADELVQPTVRIESDAIVASRDRARAALLAASLMAKPLSHQSYTALLREGRVKGPSVARIVQLFGSWTTACNEVGVTSGEPLRSNYERTWTEDDLLNYVERFLRDTAFRGASHQFDQWRSTVNHSEKVPSLGTVRNIVGGTWNDIRSQALRRMRAKWDV